MKQKQAKIKTVTQLMEKIKPCISAIAVNEGDLTTLLKIRYLQLNLKRKYCIFLALMIYKKIDPISGH